MIIKPEEKTFDDLEPLFTEVDELDPDNTGEIEPNIMEYLWEVHLGQKYDRERIRRNP